MQKNNTMLKFMIVEFLAFACWLAMLFLFNDLSQVGVHFWWGLGFGAFAFIVSGISFALTELKSNRNLTEINVIPVYYTIGYLIATIGLNTSFVFLSKGLYNLYFDGANVVLFLIFLIIRINTNQYGNRVEEQTEYLSEKIATIAEISSKIGTLVGLTEDAELKKQLLKLKESVDYSSNLSQECSQNTQNQFLSQLEQIQGLLQSNGQSEEIGKIIKEAGATWKMRNSLVSTMK